MLFILVIIIGLLQMNVLREVNLLVVLVDFIIVSILPEFDAL